MGEALSVREEEGGIAAGKRNGSTTVASELQQGQRLGHPVRAGRPARGGAVTAPEIRHLDQRQEPASRYRWASPKTQQRSTSGRSSIMAEDVADPIDALNALMSIRHAADLVTQAVD